MIETITRLQAQWQQDRLTSAAEILGQAAIERFVSCVKMVADRLARIDYPVSPLLGPVYPDIDERIQRLHQATGIEPPKVLAYLWKSVGSIQFTDHINCTHDVFWRKQGLGKINSDGLHICPCEDSYIDMYETGYIEQPVSYLISPDIYEKDNCSGGGGVEIHDDSEWSPTCIGFSDIANCRTLTTARNCDLISYLRAVVLECGCFPGFMGHRQFEPIREQLTDSLPEF